MNILKIYDICISGFGDIFYEIIWFFLICVNVLIVIIN